jgi:hypothetical protein
MMTVDGRGWSLGRDRMKHGTRGTRMPLAPRRNSRRRGRWLLVALTVSCAVIVGAVMGPHAASVTGRMLVALKKTSGSSSQSAAPSTSPAVASTCSDIYFISARGSGQLYGKRGDTTAAEKATDMSVSPETDAVLTAMKDELHAKGVTTPIITDQLGPAYTAQSTAVLDSGLAAYKSALANWQQIVDVDVPKYMAGEKAGETELLDYLTTTYQGCLPTGREPAIVLAGYSQGSMVIHNVLNTLAADNQTDYMSMIKGVVLIADPERMTFSDVLNLGTAPASEYGICHLADDLNSHVCEPPGSTQDVAKHFTSMATQVCNAGDFVCDTSSVWEKSDGLPRLQFFINFLLDIKNGLRVHSDSYSNSGQLKAAARGVALNLINGVGVTSPSPSPTPSTPTPTPTSPGSWTAIAAPPPADPADPSTFTGITYDSLSCPSTSSCAAAGSYLSPVSTGTWESTLLTRSGTSWVASDPPLPANACTDEGSATCPEQGSLGAVTCPSASACVAVGNYQDGSTNLFGNVGGLLLTGSGSSWTATAAAVPDDAAHEPEVSLDGVTCASASACTTIGSYQDSDYDTQGLLLTGSGASWTATEAPLPANAAGDSTQETYAGLRFVTCPTAAECVVTGSYHDTSGNTEGLLLTGSGSSWQAAEAPVPANAATNSDVTLGNVVCPAASECVINGSYTDTSGNTDGLLLTGSGSSWQAAEAPLPANAAANPELVPGDVACPSTSGCVITGSYTDTSGNTDGLLLTGSGSSWQAAEAPIPANGTHVLQLGPVACPSESACVVLGDYLDSSGGVNGLVLEGPA